jgi:hypothetical protein
MPPWPQEQWREPSYFVSEPLRGASEIVRFAKEQGLEQSFANAAEQGVAAVVSGNSFDNAMGTHPYGEGGQELSVYLTVNSLPSAELNLANLCAWACAGQRGQEERSRPGKRLLDAGDLATFADDLKLRPDWHEPGEADLGARVVGQLLDCGPDGLLVKLSHDFFDEQQRTFVSGETLAEVALVDLLAWACGFESPQVRLEATPRLRPSGLASRREQ